MPGARNYSIAGARIATATRPAEVRDRHSLGASSITVTAIGQFFSPSAREWHERQCGRVGWLTTMCGESSAICVRSKTQVTPRRWQPMVTTRLPAVHFEIRHIQCCAILPANLVTGYCLQEVTAAN